MGLGWLGSAIDAARWGFRQTRTAAVPFGEVLWVVLEVLRTSLRSRTGWWSESCSPIITTYYCRFVYCGQPQSAFFTGFCSDFDHFS